MSDQLFWIFSILLIVEILSQILQFDSMGKVFVQFYSLMVHGLVGLTLASFETNQLIYYFLILITFVNGFRYIIHRIEFIHDRSGLKFVIDTLIIGLLMILMAQIDPYLSFGVVPGFEPEIQLAILAILAVVLIYEMLQRALKTGLHIEEFLPASIVSSLTTLAILIIGFGLSLNIIIELSDLFRYLSILVFIVVIIVIRLVTSFSSKDPRHYDILYVLPTFFGLLTFIEIALLGG